MGMSMMDCINTVAWLLQPFLVPRASGRLWAVGNQQSCQAVGFFSQLGSSVTVYNAVLAINFWLVVVLGMPDATIRSKYEPYMHGFAVLYPLVTAAIAAGLHIMYSELELGMACWICKYTNYVF